MKAVEGGCGSSLGHAEFEMSGGNPSRNVGSCKV